MFTNIIVIGQSQILDEVIDSGHGGVLKHLGQIAHSMYEWEGPVADNLGLHQADVAKIKEACSGKLELQTSVCFTMALFCRIGTNNSLTNRRAALEKWKQYNGSSATYRNLIAAFERAGHKDFAETVQKMAGKCSKACTCTFMMILINHHNVPPFFSVGVLLITSSKQATAVNIQPQGGDLSTTAAKGEFKCIVGFATVSAYCSVSVTIGACINTTFRLFLLCRRYCYCIWILSPASSKPLHQFL